MDDFFILLRSSFSSQYKAAKTYDQIHYLLLRRQIARHTILTPKYLVRNLQKLAKLISSRSSWISCSIWGNMSKKFKIDRSEISFKSFCKFFMWYLGIKMVWRELYNLYLVVGAIPMSWGFRRGFPNFKYILRFIFNSRCRENKRVETYSFLKGMSLHTTRMMNPWVQDSILAKFLTSFVIFQNFFVFVEVSMHSVPQKYCAMKKKITHCALWRSKTLFMFKAIEFFF